MVTNKSVTVIGLGYVGLPLALLALKNGFTVTGLDIDEAKIKSIQRKICPFYDPAVERDLKLLNLNISSDLTVVKAHDIVIICVPTPVKSNYTPDLEPLLSACTQVGQYLQNKQLVIIESTINPGVCEEVLIPLIEKQSGKICGTDFYLAHCPERINPGDTTWNVSNIARVLGANDETSLGLAYEFYSKIIDAPIRKMANLKEAEAVKIVENSYRDINIAFVNELAVSFTLLGIDVVNVINDAATKPFSFMAHYPGAGVGGHCIPVDPYYLIEYAHKNGFTHKFLKIARDINNHMPRFTVDRLNNALKEIKVPLKGIQVTVLGLSYKANVGDIRESPSLQIIKLLQKAQATVVVHDPYVSQYQNALQKHPFVPTPIEDLEAAVTGSRAIVVATAHNEYKDLSLKSLRGLGIRVIVDGRNCLDKRAVIEAGLIYKGIGR